MVVYLFCYEVYVCDAYTKFQLYISRPANVSPLHRVRKDKGKSVIREHCRYYFSECGARMTKITYTTSKKIRTVVREYLHLRLTNNVCKFGIALRVNPVGLSCQFWNYYINQTRFDETAASVIVNHYNV